MTDKEQINDSLKNQNKNFNENFTCENRTVIIDGVDVSKCKYFEDGECGCEYYLRYGYEITMYDRCEEYPNCYFKQLARKTQECEELKDTLSKLTQGVVLPLSEPEVINLADRYRKALEEVEIMLQAIVQTNKVYPLQNNLFKILDIINKARRK